MRYGLLFLSRMIARCPTISWTTLFFGLRNPGLALVDIALLLLAIAATILAFRRASAAAAWLLAPYLAWASYAAALNAAIWRMN